MQRLPVNNPAISAKQESILATNAVIKNTYILLSLTLLFSAATAFYAVVSHAQPVSIAFFLIGVFGLQYITFLLRNSVWGIATTFAFTGLLGYTLGPIISYYLQLVNGTQIVTAALGLTGAIFFGLSGYAMTTRKDFSYMGGFLMAGVMVAFLASLLGIFFQIPALHLAISSAFVLLAAGFILYETSSIIHGGQRNYILATISLYVQIYNMFISLLHLLGAFSGRND